MITLGHGLHGAVVEIPVGGVEGEVAVVGLVDDVELLEVLGEAVQGLLVHNEALGSHEVTACLGVAKHVEDVPASTSQA